MKTFRYFLAAALAMSGGALPAWAATAGCTVSMTVLTRAEITLVRDANSVSRGTASTLVFDTYDDVDTTGGSSTTMYSPKRTAEAGKNWHMVSVIGNGSTTTLSAAVTGTVGASTPLKDRLDCFFGGFFRASDGGSEGGGSGAWESMDGFSRSLGSFSGTGPFNYRLRLDSIPAGSYSGSITFTLTST